MTGSRTGLQAPDNNLERDDVKLQADSTALLIDSIHRLITERTYDCGVVLLSLLILSNLISIIFFLPTGETWMSLPILVWLTAVALTLTVLRIADALLYDNNRLD